MCQAVHEGAREQVTRTISVDGFHWVGGDVDQVRAVVNHRAFCAQSDGECFGKCFHCFHGFFDAAFLCVTQRFDFIAEQQVDAVADGFGKIVAKMFHYKRVGKSERGFNIVLFGDLTRSDVGRFAGFRGGEITFQVTEAGVLDRFFADFIR